MTKCIVTFSLFNAQPTPQAWSWCFVLVSGNKLSSPASHQLWHTLNLFPATECPLLVLTLPRRVSWKVKPSKNVHFLELSVFPEHPWTVPIRTGHLVAFLWQMKNLSPWMLYDVTRARKGLTACSFTLTHPDTNLMTPVLTFTLS